MVTSYLNCYILCAVLLSIWIIPYLWKIEAGGHRKKYQAKKKYLQTILTPSKGCKYNGSHTENEREQCSGMWLKHPN
jgi:hypothetical protein